jgi:hypothetical protein
MTQRRIEAHGPKWTTRTLPELTRQYGVEELHTVCFAPKDWVGKGATVSLGIPECELACADVGPNGEPVAMVNRPKVNLNVRHWTRAACGMAVEQRAFMIFNCDTAAQAETIAKRAARLLPNYQRVALEWMYDAATRVADKLS